MFPPIYVWGAVDAIRRAAYIGAGPHRPNAVLSFWKE
jgi:hypothetical protein